MLYIKEVLMDPRTQYSRRFIAAIVAYAILLLASIPMMRIVEPLWGRALLAVLPVIPVIYGLAAIVGAVRALDEFQQRVQLEAAVFSLAGTALITFTYGFLENAGFPQVSLIWVLPLIALLWGIGGAIAGRKYR
jgi:hypothetical protein